MGNVCTCGEDSPVTVGYTAALINSVCNVAGERHHTQSGD